MIKSVTTQLCFVITIVDAFFVNGPLKLENIRSRRNLTCLVNYGDTDTLSSCEYCVYEYFTNGTDSTTSLDCIYLTNTYRLVSKRCSGFSSASDVGYGICSPLPFEYFEIDLLCICADDFCNVNFATCKISADKNRHLPPLPSPIPSLTSESSFISCQDTLLGTLRSTYYCVRDSTPYIDMNQCIDYVRKHTVLCMITEVDNGTHLNVIALPDEDYEYVLANQIETMQRNSMVSTISQYFNETRSNFFLYTQEYFQGDNDGTLLSNRCYCRQNSCNVDLASCIRSTMTNRQERKELSTTSLFMIFVFYFSKLQYT